MAAAPAGYRTFSAGEVLTDALQYYTGSAWVAAGGAGGGGFETNFLLMGA